MKKFKSTKDIKVGVVGYGGAFNMGQQHLQQMKKAGMTPFAVCEIDPERLKVAEDDFPGIETYGSLDAMLKQSDVNLLVHITPHNLHYPLAAKCVKAGKHVVTEKPFVVTTSEADRLINLANKHNVMVSTYHNRHWDGWIMRAVREIVEKKTIGDVYKVEAHFGGYGMPRDWWRTSKSVSGGVLYDWGCHLLEYTLQVVDSDIVEVSGYAKNGYWESQAPKNFPWIGDMNEDEATAVVRFANGCVANLCITQLDPVRRPPLTFYGTKGTYIINHFGWQDDPQQWILKKANRKHQIKETSGKHPKSRGDLFYKNIAEYMTGQADLVITPEWARRPIHILDLAGKSAQAGKAMKAKHA
ncbi:Gfo/Idh/MocA family protein [Algisphaera agarilytica]|uniref:Putative dehydrogenase n=1 Tax=Algisphaera agarilytica TaxID=1385975 RepID=A0A7X0H6M8_9BACT|nr:Gfo/Idh/MocA family oxidoreductase [Algisphaera agarilytica]MBB6430257.1 putative dehydrogenase [Algisphaera agarilytica]